MEQVRLPRQNGGSCGILGGCQPFDPRFGKVHGAFSRGLGAWLLTDAAIRRLIAEDNLKVKNALLKEFEAKSEQETRLFATISHELRTPLASLRLISEDIANLKPEQASDYLQQTFAQLEAATDDLAVAIDPSKPIVLHESPFGFWSLGDHVRQQVAPVFNNRGIYLLTELGKDEQLKLIGDPGRLGMILTNLLRNSALHANAEHTWFKQRVTESNLGPDFKRVTWTIEDDGDGIPQDQIERLRLPFERGESKSEGTGLGLFVVRATCAAMKADVTYETSETGGAKFVISADLKVVSRNHGAASSKPTDPTTRGRYTVLIVEDNTMIRKMTSRILAKAGYNTVQAGDGKSGLKQIAEKPIDAVITDYFMPEMDGVEMMLALREQGFTQPIIAVSAATLRDEPERLLAAGAKRVLAKPVSSDDLCSALDEVLSIDSGD